MADSDPVITKFVKHSIISGRDVAIWEFENVASSASVKLVLILDNCFCIFVGLLVAYSVGLSEFRTLKKKKYF